MPSCCGSGASCACKVSPGTGIDVSGSGSAQDPFVITADINLIVDDNPRFNLTLTGNGSTATPWHLSVDYATTSKLDDVPDVNAPGPANGQVLGWDSSTSQWTPRAPTTAAAGSVLHGPALSGDGSAGTPLAVVPDTARLIQTSGSGVGLNDVGMNSVVRRYPDDVTRAATTPAPALNSLSMLDSNPGRIDYWDGTQWTPLQGRSDTAIVGGDFLSLSGDYNGSQRLTHYLKQVALVSDASGNVDVLDISDLGGRGGVIACMFQETRPAPPTSAFKAMLYPNTDRVSAIIFSVVDGTVMPGVAVTGMVDAWLY